MSPTVFRVAGIDRFGLWILVRGKEYLGALAVSCTTELHPPRRTVPDLVRGRSISIRGGESAARGWRSVGLMRPPRGTPSLPSTVKPFECNRYYIQMAKDGRGMEGGAGT